MRGSYLLLVPTRDTTAPRSPPHEAWFTSKGATSHSLPIPELPRNCQGHSSWHNQASVWHPSGCIEPNQNLHSHTLSLFVGHSLSQWPEPAHYLITLHRLFNTSYYHDTSSMVLWQNTVDRGNPGSHIYRVRDCTFRHTPEINHTGQPKTRVSVSFK